MGIYSIKPVRILRNALHSKIKGRLLLHTLSIEPQKVQEYSCLRKIKVMVVSHETVKRKDKGYCKFS